MSCVLAIFLTRSFFRALVTCRGNLFIKRTIFVTLRFMKIVRYLYCAQFIIRTFKFKESCYRGTFYFMRKFLVSRTFYAMRHFLKRLLFLSRVRYFESIFFHELVFCYAYNFCQAYIFFEKEHLFVKRTSYETGMIFLTRAFNINSLFLSRLRF